MTELGLVKQQDEAAATPADTKKPATPSVTAQELIDLIEYEDISADDRSLQELKEQGLYNVNCVSL